MQQLDGSQPLHEDRMAEWPRLTTHNHGVTSPEDRDYNCAAWAASDQTRPWWPYPGREDYYFWPAGLKRELTLESMMEGYATLGYEPCDSAEPEVGFEKIAIYLYGAEPTHVARLLEDGRWTSKLGDYEDIWHLTPQDVEDGFWEYGDARQYMRRPREQDA